MYLSVILIICSNVINMLFILFTYKYVQGNINDKIISYTVFLGNLLIYSVYFIIMKGKIYFKSKVKKEIINKLNYLCEFECEKYVRFDRVLVIN